MKQKVIMEIKSQIFFSQYEAFTVVPPWIKHHHRKIPEQELMELSTHSHFPKNMAICLTPANTWYSWFKKKKKKSDLWDSGLSWHRLCCSSFGKDRPVLRPFSEMVGWMTVVIAKNCISKNRAVCLFWILKKNLHMSSILFRKNSCNMCDFHMF